MSTTYTEQELPEDVRNVHRAIASLIEELEAINWYHQRVAVTQDAELKAILAHNRDEEVEHASMALEWLRRQLPQFDANLKTYLFTNGPVTQVEQTAGAAGGKGAAPDASLDIGNLSKGGK
jgi:ferritin-like protein